MTKWQRSVLVCMLIPLAGFGANAVWDGSTDTGFQNVNGTWGTGSNWSFNGTSLNVWDPANGAFFGGNGSVSASPSGNFTVTVSGTQTCVVVRQPQNGAGDFTLEGGTIVSGAAGTRVDRGTFTVNSVLDGSTATFQLSVQTSDAVLVLGGSNTFTGIPEIRGILGGTVRLDNADALGASSALTFYNTGVMLDLNGLDISGRAATVNNGQTGFIGNSGTDQSTWSGDVTLVGSGNIRAGGSNGELELSGAVIGGGQLQVMDSGVLRLSGANTGHTGLTVIRPDGMLIVNNAEALGSTTGITYVQNDATLDLNGFNVGAEEINMQKLNSAMVNEATGAATVSGPVSMPAGGIKFGGSGDLNLSGEMSGAAGFTKIGTGTLTLSASNSYAGAVIVSEGSLAGGAGAFAGSAQVSVAGGAELALQDTAALNADVMLRLDSSAALALDYSGTQTVMGLSLDGGSSWLVGGTYDASQLSSINASGIYSGSGMILVSGPSDSFEILPGGSNLVINWVGEYGVWYAVESRTNLLTGTWLPIVTNQFGTGGWLSYTGTITEAENFYRIIEE
jgi:fibronectin-binding autotransporter adhesin